MKVAHALIASIIAFTSLHLHAADGPIEVSTAKLTLKQQYAELEDLKTQLSLAQNAGGTNLVTFIVSSSLIGAGLIMDILGGPGAKVKNLASLTASDSVIIIGAVGATTSGIVLKLDDMKINDLTKKINDLQGKIAEAAEGML